MKVKLLFSAILLAALMFTGCDDEKKLAPTDMGNFDRFTFPQGTNSYDLIFKQIFDDHNIMCLYKDFTSFDLARTWTGTNVNVSTMEFDYFTDAELTDLAVWLKTYYFDFLGPDVTKGLFKRYMFLTKDYKNGGFRYYVNTAGLDFWTLSPETASFASGTPAPKDSSMVWGTVDILAKMIEGAVETGAITMPSSFYTGVDFTTETTSRSTGLTSAPGTDGYKNYVARRGFLISLVVDGGLNDTAFQWYGAAGRNISATGDGNVYTLENIKNEPYREVGQFVRYPIWDRKYWGRFNTGGYFEDCPLLYDRTNILLNHLLTEYGIDIAAFKTLAWSKYRDS